MPNWHLSPVMGVGGFPAAQTQHLYISGWQHGSQNESVQNKQEYFSPYYQAFKENAYLPWGGVRMLSTNLGDAPSNVYVLSAQ